MIWPSYRAPYGASAQIPDVLYGAPNLGTQAVTDTAKGFCLIGVGDGRVISGARFYCTAITGTGGTYSVTVEGLDASGVPSGTPLTGGTAITGTPAVGEIAVSGFTAAPAVGVGYAVVCRGTGVDGSNNFTLRTGLGAYGVAEAILVKGRAYATAWGTLQSPGALVEYADGSFGGGTVYLETNYAGATTAVFGGRARGNRFIVPDPGWDIAGVMAGNPVSQGTPTDLVGRLYRGDTLVAESASYPEQLASTSGLPPPLPFPSPVHCEPGEDIRLVVATTGGTSSNYFGLRCYTFFNSAAVRSSMAGSPQMTYWDGSAWTDTPAEIARVFPLLAAPRSTGGRGPMIRARG